MRPVIWILLMFLTAALSDPDRCPDKCKCSSHFKTILCENQKLTTIPEGIPKEATELFLGQNLIDSLPANAFVNLTNLSNLSLKNNYLVNIDVAAFRGLVNLKYLSLTNNKISALQKDHFIDLGKLQRLYLTQNEMTQIPDLQYCASLTRLNIDNNRLAKATFPAGFSNLTTLSSIILANNPLTELTLNDVTSLWHAEIRDINIARCSVKDIESASISQFAHMQSLDLSYNKQLNISAIQNTIRGLRNATLTYLGLAGVIQQSSLPADLFGSGTAATIKTLDMSHMEKVEVIQNGTFANLVNLEYLDLSRSSIRVIDDGAFGGPNVKLVRLNLAHNNINKIPDKLPPSLQILDMTNNWVDELNNNQFLNMTNLRTLTLSLCRIHKIESDAFVGASGLLSLNLSRNELAGSGIANAVFTLLPNLRTLDLSNNKMTTIPTQSKLFSELASLEELYLSGNLLHDIVTDLFRPLISLKRLDLSDNILGEVIEVDNGIIFQNLHKLEDLRIVNSELSRLPMLLLRDQTALRVLNMSNNHISEWDAGFFRSTVKLEQIDFSANKIAIINETSVEDFRRGVTLHLASNPFSCWCDLVWFRDWLDQVNNASGILLPGNDSYTCNSPQSMLDRKVIEFDPRAIEEECSPPPWKVIVVCTASGIVAVGIVFALVGYRNRWSIRLRIYRMRKSCACRSSPENNSYQTIPGDDEPVRYDACISYGPGEKDVDWVKDVLVPKLDVEFGGQFKLFFDDRDALFNESGIGQIVDAMYVSKTIILVLSSDYLKNSRREFEIKSAVSMLEERSMQIENTIIPIILEPEIEHKAPRLLQVLFSNHLELEWSDDNDGRELFWMQLENKLQSRKCDPISV